MAISLKALASESLNIGKLQGGVLPGQREHEFLWCDAWFAFLETSVYPEQAGEMREGRVIIIPSFLTLKEGATFLTKPLFNSLYAPFCPPVLGDRNPQGREDVTVLQYSVPLRYKVGGVSKPCAMVVRDGTA